MNRIQQIVAFNLWRARVRHAIHLRRRVLQMRTFWRAPTRWNPTEKSPGNCHATPGRLRPILPVYPLPRHTGLSGAQERPLSKEKNMSDPKTKQEAMYAANEARDSAIREHDIAQMAGEDGEPTLALLHRTRAAKLERRATHLHALAQTLPSLPD